MALFQWAISFRSKIGKKQKTKGVFLYTISLFDKKGFSRMYKEKKIFKKNRKMSVDAVFKEVPSFISDKKKRGIHFLM